MTRSSHDFSGVVDTELSIDVFQPCAILELNLHDYTRIYFNWQDNAKWINEEAPVPNLLKNERLLGAQVEIIVHRTRKIGIQRVPIIKDDLILIIQVDGQDVVATW